MEKCLFLRPLATARCSPTAAVAVAPPVLLLSAARLAVSARADPLRPPAPASVRTASPGSGSSAIASRIFLFRPWWVPRGRLAQANSSRGASVLEHRFATAWPAATLKDRCCWFLSQNAAGAQRSHTAWSEMDAQVRHPVRYD